MALVARSNVAKMAINIGNNGVSNVVDGGGVMPAEIHSASS
jgi:hypothetical protein